MGPSAPAPQYVVTPDMVNTYNTSVTGVQPFERNGRSLVRLNLANGKAAVVNTDQLFGQGIAVPSAAIGLTIQVSFFKQGAMLINGTRATQDDFLVQSFQISGHEGAMEDINADLYKEVQKDLLKESIRKNTERRARFVRTQAAATPVTPPVTENAKPDLPPVGVEDKGAAEGAKK